MIVAISVPEISEYPNGFPQYWLKYAFIGSISPTFQVNALATNYIRLVEAALIEYRLGDQRLREFWDLREGFKLGAMNMSISHFENVLSDMHRATRFFSRLRHHKDLPPELRASFNTIKPKFVAAKIAKKIGDMRNAIHHAEADLMKDAWQVGNPIALNPTGSETSHPTEAGQTIKTIDRLSIGSHKLLFSEIATSLREMAFYAQKIAAYDRPASWPS
jgi:hypothetical protein